MAGYRLEDLPDDLRRDLEELYSPEELAALLHESADGLHERVALLRVRIQAQEHEARAQERVADLMERRGYRHSGELLAAVERGDLELLPDEIEALMRLGAL